MNPGTELGTVHLLIQFSKLAANGLNDYWSHFINEESKTKRKLCNLPEGHVISMRQNRKFKESLSEFFVLHFFPNVVENERLGVRSERQKRVEI